MNTEITLKPFIKQLRMALPEFGKIKIGGKDSKVRKTESGREWQAPVKFDHFVITSLEKDEHKNFIKDEEIHKTLGDEPKRIPIRLLYNTWYLNFPTKYSCFKGDDEICKGDGENAIRKTDKGDEYVTCPCDHADKDYAGNYPCKRSGCLSCIIDGTERLGGVYKFRTSSFNATNAISASLLWIFTQTHGILAGIPFDLVLNTKTGKEPKTNKTVKVIFATIEFRAGIAALIQEAKEIRQLEAGYANEIKLIESQASETVMRDLDEQTSDPEEFYPEPAIIEGIPGETITENGTKVNTDTGEILEETSGTDFELTPKTEPVKPQAAGRVKRPEPKPVTVPADEDDDVF